MIGGFSTPKKDRFMKTSAGSPVKTGQILCRGVSTYKAGKYVGGVNTLYALCPGKVYFSRKKTSHGRPRTFINVMPAAKKA